MKIHTHEDTYTFMITCPFILPRIRNISDKSCRENQNSHSTFSNIFFPESRAFCEIMWKNVVQPDRPRITIRHMRFASWITKATDTHSEYVILIALPRNSNYVNMPQFYSYKNSAWLVIIVYTGSSETSMQGPDRYYMDAEGKSVGILPSWYRSHWQNGFCSQATHNLHMTVLTT